MKEISTELLTRLAGTAAFNRGEVYFQDGAVGEIKKSGHKILVEVQGNELYQVSLVHTENSFEGSCDCPASDNFDFCKHCVAAALQYRQNQTELEQQKQGGVEDRLLAYLSNLDKEQLVSELSDFIKSDKATLEQWTLRADAALDLVEYALERVGRALETIDDSGGFRYEAVELLHQMHWETCARLDWTAEKLAQHLAAIFFSESVEIYPNLPDSYQQILKPAGMAAFNTIIEQHWNALPALSPGAEWNAKWDYLRLQPSLISAAEARGDIDCVISLKAKTATERQDYLRISEYCLEKSRTEEAQAWLEKARQGAQRYYRIQIEQQQVQIWVKQGRFQEALQKQWEIYCESLEVSDFALLGKIPKQPDSADHWLERASSHLKTKITEAKEKYARQQFIDALAELLLHQKQNQAALSLAEEYPVNVYLLMAIAEGNSDQPKRVLPLYVRCAAFEVNQKNNHAYKQAIKILKKARQVGGSDDKEDFNRVIDQIRTEHKAKRNFIKWLNEAFPITSQD